MRAMQVVEIGRMPETAELAMPRPGPGELRIRVAACGLNFADLLMIGGTYQERPALPFVPGMEFAGTTIDFRKRCCIFFRISGISMCPVRNCRTQSMALQNAFRPLATSERALHSHQS